MMMDNIIRASIQKRVKINEAPSLTAAIHITLRMVTFLLLHLSDPFTKKHT